VADLESRYRYSNEIVYNNFPWPENPSEKQIKAIETAAQKVLRCARLAIFGKFISRPYTILDTMPPALTKSTQRLRQSRRPWPTDSHHLQPKPTEWCSYLSSTKNIRQIYLQKRK
jgi:hypothetical protein